MGYDAAVVTALLALTGFAGWAIVAILETQRRLHVAILDIMRLHDFADRTKHRLKSLEDDARIYEHES